MFTLLSGRHVHEGVSGNEQLILSATTPAPSLASVEPDVPPELVALVDRALAFDRARRWVDASSMQRAVSAALAQLGGPDVAEPSSARRPATSTVLSAGVTPARLATARKVSADSELSSRIARAASSKPLRRSP